MAALVKTVVIRTPATVGAAGQYTALAQCRDQAASARGEATAAASARNAAQASLASAQAAQALAESARDQSRQYRDESRAQRGVLPHQAPPAWSLGSAAFQDIRMLDASVTWDPPSVAAGAQASTAVTVPGAAPGDFVMASCAAALPGLSLRAEATGADAVTLWLANLTGAAVDAGSNTFYLRIVKRIP